MRATDGILQLSMLRTSRLRRAAPTIVLASTGLVATLGLFLFVRRVTGAFTAPLPAAQLITTGAALCLWVLVTRELAAERIEYYFVALITLVLVAVACSFPATRVVDWLVWIPAIGIASINPKAVQQSSTQPPATTDSPAAEDPDEAEAEQVLQQLTRFRTPDGADAMRGVLTAEFRAGERQTTVYVGFCPPFGLLPQVEAASASEFEAEVKPIQILHNGAQLEVRLDEPAEEPLAVSIEFFASHSI